MPSVPTVRVLDLSLALLLESLVRAENREQFSTKDEAERLN